MPAMELVTGGAQVEAAAHRARALLRSAIDQADAPAADPTVAGELVEAAFNALTVGLGLQVERGPLSDEQMDELSRDEQHIDEIAGRAA